MQKVHAARVIIFGVGGVGSWCAESLIRSGVGQLTVVDSDCVCASNINRQLPATADTVGKAKVEVLKERLMTINPHAQINALQKIYSPETSESFCLGTHDYIIDAIDSLSNKVHLIQTATGTQATFFSSMGAALKLDPGKISVAEFWKIQGCPLAAALRRKIKQSGMFPQKRFLCVYSPEMRENHGNNSETEHGIYHKAQINGTLAHITAIFGFTLAGLVMKDICSIEH